MPFISKRSKLKITKKENEKLTIISKSRKEEKRRVERAQMLLYYYENKTISKIARLLHTNRPRVERCIDKALEFGVLTALEDLPRKGRTPIITDDSKAWLLSIACMKPKEVGFASEHWTLKELAGYIRGNCMEAGYPSLARIRKGTVSKILSKSDIKPHKVTYYTEKRDPDFDRKMTQVLHFYKEVELYCSEGKTESVYLSYDEKPGIQALGNIAADLRPLPGKYKTWKKDREYKRYGTLSLLASIDLLTGRVYGKVYERHRSREFVEYLRYIDSLYPKQIKIKIVLDNHSSHISKETKAYLKTMPNRFEFIFTPTHGSWLNLIEVFFSKMARSFLRGIRVASKNELKSRIVKYLDEVNQMPTVFKWTWKMKETEIIQQSVA